MTDEGPKNAPSLEDLRELHNQMPRWVIILLLVGIGAAIAYHIAHLLMTLTIATVIAYVLGSAVSRAEALGIKRNILVILLFLFFALFIIGADVILAPYLEQEVKGFYAKLPEFSMRIDAALSTAAPNTAQTYPTAELAIRKLIGNAVGPGRFLERMLNLSELLMQATPFIMGIVLVPFFVFFMLKDGPGVLKKILDRVPASEVETTVSVIAEIHILVGKYLRGLAADCFFMGVMASLGLWLIGVNYPITLGVLSGMANVIPYLGPIMACSVSCLAALVQFNGLDTAVNVIILFVFIKVIDDLFVQPLVIGKTVRLHPMLLVITIIAGEKLFGIGGMILGVPIVTAAQKTAAILIEHRRERLRRETPQRILRHHQATSPVRPI